MSEEVDTRDQRILDARMEYDHLLKIYLSLANMFWVGYGAFFTINTLLATALGFSYSSGAQSFDETFLKLARPLLSVTGMFTSLIVIYAAIRINKFQILVKRRGRELEKLIFARAFTELQPYSKSFPTGTTIGSLLFLAIWASALYATVQF